MMTGSESTPAALDLDALERKAKAAAALGERWAPYANPQTVLSLIAAARRLESLVAFCQARIEQCIDAEAQGIPHPGSYREGRMAAFLAVQERIRGPAGEGGSDGSEG